MKRYIYIIKVFLFQNKNLSKQNYKQVEENINKLINILKKIYEKRLKLKSDNIASIEKVFYILG